MHCRVFFKYTLKIRSKNDKRVYQTFMFLKNRTEYPTAGVSLCVLLFIKRDHI